MTTTTSTSSTTTSTRAVTAVGVASCLVAIAGTSFGAHSWTEILIVTAILVACTALVFGKVVPNALRKTSAGGTALGLSIPALLLLVPAFWSGLPLVLGVAGAILGNAGRRAPTGAGKCIAALAIGALAALGYLATYISDAMNGGAGFLFQ